MIVVVAGSRKYRKLTAVTALVESFPLDYRVLTGGAQGVDERAYSIAKRRGIALPRMNADWDTDGLAAGAIRNRKMLDAADCVYAFWDGKSSGTEDMINIARQAGKLKAIYGHDGKLMEEI